MTSAQKLQIHVTNVAFSKKLKELGAIQESCFRWYKIHNKTTGKTYWTLSHGSGAGFADKVLDSVAAFLGDELIALNDQFTIEESISDY